MLQYDGSKKDDFSIAILNKFREWIEKHLHFTVTVGVGDETEDISLVSESYKEAVEALNYKMAGGSNRMILFCQISAQSGDDLYYYLHAIRSIVHALAIQEDWEKPLECLDYDIRKERLPRQSIIQLIQYLGYQLQSTIGKLAFNFGEGVDDIPIPLFVMHAGKLDSLDKLFEHVRQDLSRFQHQLQQSRGDRKHFNLLLEIKNYIDSNYHDPNLSLESLSEKFNIGSKNLSKLFKEEFGENFIDFLTRLRIDHAKELLITSNLPVQEIASAVAYSSSFAFGRVFKRLVGTTPTAYRESEGR